MSKKIITSIGPTSWERYGERFAKAFKQYWPQDIELEVWHHHLNGNVPEFEGITFRCLDDLPAFQQITSRLGAQAKDGPSLSYCFKALALASSVTPDLDWIGFIDADTETMRPVDNALLDEIFDPEADLTYLYRKSAAESEGSWFAFNLRTIAGASLLADYYGLYVSMEFLHYKKSHDNAILDRLVTIHRAHGLRVKNVANGALGLDAFHQSPLGAYLVHYKGPQKNVIADPGLGAPSRYENLCEVVQHSVKSTNRAYLVEVGTWNGSRAVQMAEAAFAAGAQYVGYVGFDTFDDGNDRVLEGHTKVHASYDIVRMRLENYATLMARKEKTFHFTLIKGNTTETLPKTRDLVRDATLAYIDGGHSLETVQSDYENLRHVPYIVFDDVVKSEHPKAPNGPYEVFKKAVGKLNLIQTSDPYFIDNECVGEIGLGLVTKENNPPFVIKQRLQVKPVDSVDKSEQFAHIDENTAAIDEWLEFAQAHTRTALLVSAGPTLKDYLEDIKEKQAGGAVVFAVKHAYPMLRAAGIQPDFTVVLDPRPVDGLSTHGVVRTTLFEQMTPSDKVLLASMTNPSVRRELESKKVRLIGWHAHTFSTQVAQPNAFKKGMIIAGGTCAATRMPMLAFTLGFRRFEFYGYDFFYPSDAKQEDIKQPLMKVMVGDEGREFLTTGELIAAMQDLGQWNKWLVENRLAVTFHGDGAGNHVWKSTVKSYENPKEYPY